MSVYVIILESAQEQVWDKLKEEWPNHSYLMPGNPTIAFVAPPGITIESSIGRTLGINEKEDVTGLVVELSGSTYGFVAASVADWIRKAFNG